MVKHVSFFESIKLRDKPVPIQKMVTTPLSSAASRSGSPRSAERRDGARRGADFTATDLRHAKEIFDAVAPFLAQARPADY